MKITNEEFLLRIKLIYKDRNYDYTKTVYTGSHNKVIITCSVHGDFEIEPRMIYKNKGCPYCENRRIIKNDSRNKTTEEFINQAKQVHKNKYLYDKTIYTKAHNKVIITCPIHGDFEQTASVHISGSGCPKCAQLHKSELRRDSLEDFIEKARRIHGDKYDYSNVDYINNSTKVSIICPEHGEFYLRPSDHLSGKGCLECGKIKSGINHRLSTEEFIQKAREVHGNKYDYSKTNYINTYTKLIIICPIHGEFELLPHNHLSNCGCPKCNSSKGENYIKNYLEENNINFIYLYKIDVPKDIRKSGKIFVDFYLPDYNLFIEYNGKQHYIPVEYFGGEINLQKLLNRDNYLRIYSFEHNINLLEISYKDDLEKCLKNYL